MDQQRAILGTVKTVPRRTVFVAHPPSWTERAKCIGRWSEYDGSPDGLRGASSRRAKELCAGCPVRAECLEDALEAEGGIPFYFRDGVRGGLNAMERSRLSRLIALADTGLCPCDRHEYSEDYIEWDGDRPLCTRRKAA